MIASRLRRAARAAFFALLPLAGLTAGAYAAPEHPLDPLDAAEMAVSKTVLEESKKLDADVIYPWAQLREPPKAEVLAWTPGKPFRREAYVVALSRARKSSYEAVVDLRNRRLISLRSLRNLQPMLVFSEFERVKDIIDADARIKAALQKRGYKIPGKVSDVVYPDAYAPGEDPWLAKHPRRAFRVLFTDRRDARNQYAPYIEGFMAILDLEANKVVRIEDHPGHSGPAVRADHDVFSREVLGPPRGGLKPLAVTQSAGPSYTRQNNRITWQGFDFRFSFNLREGLVLHQVGFRNREQNGKLRPILYRASISELLVPYADPSPQWLWREFFDSGEYGLGLSSTDVRPGRELPDNAEALDVVLPDEALKDSVYPGRIYIYERDGGPFIFHKQWTDNSLVYARGRELVIGFVGMLGNYDYFFNWVFRQDGSFQFAVDLDGIPLSKTVAAPTCQVCAEQARGGPGKTYMAAGDERYGSIMAPNILGVHHQHWVNLRLDFDVDGPVNAVKECNTRPLPADPRTNARGRAFGVTHTIFATEKAAARNVNPGTNRTWVVYNPAATSELGHPAGYAIEPQTNAPTMFPASRADTTAGFTARHFWATLFKPGEMYAAGAFPNQAPAGYADILPRWAGGEPIFKRDLVVWYSLGYTHITRPEDYPIIAPGRAAVDFRPKGFFRRSPVLDLLTIELPEPEAPAADAPAAP